MSFAQLSVTRPVTTLMFYTGVVLLGVVAFTQISVDFLPPIKDPPSPRPHIVSQICQPKWPTIFANQIRQPF
jgi:hypothetical protein